MSFFFLFRNTGEVEEPTIISTSGTSAGAATVIGRMTLLGGTGDRWRFRLNTAQLSAVAIERIRVY